MFNAVQDFTLNQLPAKRKTSQSGWISFNSVCCHHNGHSADTRGRGGIKTNANGGISYNCFNCKFKTSYIPGQHLNFKYRKFLTWLGVSENDVKRLVIEAWRIKETLDPALITDTVEQIEFQDRQLPVGAQSFFAWVGFYELADKRYDTGLVEAANYIYNRRIDLQKYDFYWTPEVEHKLSHRVIIPFKYKDQIVGYTARALNDGIKPKYHSDHPAGFVFNLNNQQANSKFVIVCEGPFDAMSIDGVSTQTNDVGEQQADLIDSLAREVIVVPDFDVNYNKQNKKVWPGENMISRAIEYGWSVSFPEWRTECKDINESVVKYGRLFTLYSILQAKESNPLKIALLAKRHKQSI